MAAADEKRFLPFLAAASCELLGEADPKQLPVQVRVSVAQKAGVTQNTVDRFLRAETFPRSQDLETMIAAVAQVAEGDRAWLDPWRTALARAEEAERAKDGLKEMLSASGSGAPLAPDSPAGRAAQAARRAGAATRKAREKSPGKQSPTRKSRRAG